MSTQVQSASSGAKGVDTIATFTPAMAARLKAAGYDFVVRYLGALHPTERDAILGAGLGLLAVGYSRRPGWAPSAALGASDGAQAVAHAQVAGLMPGMTLFCDLEGPASGTTSGDCIAYINAWAAPVVAAGFVAGVYVGYAIPMTPSQLYHDLQVTAYWASCSRPQAVAVRGYMMTQDPHANQIVAGIQVDIDTITADANGDTPRWMINVADAVA